MYPFNSKFKFYHVYFVAISAVNGSVDVTVEIPSAFKEDVSWMGFIYTSGTQFVISVSIHNSNIYDDGNREVCDIC